MLITDGHIREKNFAVIHFGHKLDAQEFIKDFGRIDSEHYKRWSDKNLKKKSFFL